MQLFAARLCCKRCLSLQRNMSGWSCGRLASAHHGTSMGRLANLLRFSQSVMTSGACQSSSRIAGLQKQLLGSSVRRFASATAAAQRQQGGASSSSRRPANGSGREGPRIGNESSSERYSRSSNSKQGYNRGTRSSQRPSSGGPPGKERWPSRTAGDVQASDARIAAPSNLPQKSSGLQAVPKDAAPREQPSASPPGAAAAGVPTAVPRNEGIDDGHWNLKDAALVATAIANETAPKQRKKRWSEHGTVLLGASEEELTALAALDNMPAYRGKQLADGIRNGAKSLDEISNVPKAWRQQLAERGVRTGRSLLHTSVGAADGTRKFLLQLYDGRLVEMVGIPSRTSNRLTACVSSQVGCPMRCSFCATGKGGFARNLAPHEIIDQVMTVQEQFGRRVSNIVFMGMGEPLLTLASVVPAIRHINSVMGIGARHITVSTVGVPNAIAKLAAEDLQVTLAVSIHAPQQGLREQLIPSAKVYPLEALMADCRQFFDATGRRVTFEYTLMDGVNSSQHHAQELAELLSRHDLRSHVNVIPWNPVADSTFQRPSNNSVHRFLAVLQDAGIPASTRTTRGLEAAAACGQLRNDFQRNPLPAFAAAT